VEGVELDPLPKEEGKDYWAMVLIYRDWNSFYFMEERKTWTDEDYFEYAKKRIREINASPP
jgi:hypothetical protein